MLSLSCRSEQCRETTDRPLSSAEMTVGVVGLGYVGLPLVVAFAEAGEAVVPVLPSGWR